MTTVEKDFIVRFIFFDSDLEKIAISLRFK